MVIAPGPKGKEGPRSSYLHRRLCGCDFVRMNVVYGSAAPVRLIELRTHGLPRKSTSTATPRTTGLEIAPFEDPSADDCCASRPVIGVAISRTIG